MAVSTDGGVNWTALNGFTDSGVNGIAIDPQLNTTLYAAATNGILPEYHRLRPELEPIESRRAPKPRRDVRGNRSDDAIHSLCRREWFCV